MEVGQTLPCLTSYRLALLGALGIYRPTMWMHESEISTCALASRIHMCVSATRARLFVCLSTFAADGAECDGGWGTGLSLRLRGGGASVEDEDEEMPPPSPVSRVAADISPLCLPVVVLSPGSMPEPLPMAVSPPRPAVRLRLQYPACPLPCPEELVRRDLDDALRANDKLQEKLELSRMQASKLRSRLKQVEAHSKELFASVNAQVRAAKHIMKDRQYELVKQTDELVEMLRHGRLDMAHLKVERRLRYAREKERDSARETAAALALALSRAEAQMQLQEKQLGVLQSKVDSHVVTRAELGESLGAAKAAIGAEKRAAREAGQAAKRAIAEEQQLRESRASAVAERDEALGQVVAAEELAARVSESARVQQEELEKTIGEMTLNHWQLSDLPERRNWNVSDVSERVYRSNDVSALVEVFSAREWRGQDICTALSKSWYGDGDPYLLGVFNSSEMWTLRLGWLRNVFEDMRRDHWNVDCAVDLRTSGPIPVSNAMMDSLRHKLGSIYNAETDSHERKPLLCHPNHTTDIVYLPYPIETRSKWVLPFQQMKLSLGVGLDANGNLASRRLRTVVQELVLEDRASGALPAHVGLSCEGERLQINLLMDGFPLDKQSIEHLCVANCSMPDTFAIHSEAMLKCVTVGRMSESNAGLKKMYDHNGLGDDVNKLIEDGFVCVASGDDTAEETTRCYLEVTCTADRKAVEANLGCGPCCVWCRCPKGLMHKLPWARSANPPVTIDEYRGLKRNIGCKGFVGWADSVELGHGCFPGEDLPRRCCVCSKKPYATVAEYIAAKNRCDRLKSSSVKKEQALYKRERSAFAALHSFQHEFSQPELRLGMCQWIPEMMHVARFLETMSQVCDIES